MVMTTRRPWWASVTVMVPVRSRDSFHARTHIISSLEKDSGRTNVTVWQTMIPFARPVWILVGRESAQALVDWPGDSLTFERYVWEVRTSRTRLITLVRIGLLIAPCTWVHGWVTGQTSRAALAGACKCTHKKETQFQSKPQHVYM